MRPARLPYGIVNCHGKRGLPIVLPPVLSVAKQLQLVLVCNAHSSLAVYCKCAISHCGLVSPFSYSQAFFCFISILGYAEVAVERYCSLQPAICNLQQACGHCSMHSGFDSSNIPIYLDSYKIGSYIWLPSQGRI
jgi:hypothetical protein